MSSIGNNVAEVTESFVKASRGSSMRRNMPNSASSQIHGTIKMDIAEHIDRKQLRFMGDGAAYAVQRGQAIADAGLSEDQCRTRAPA